MSLSIEPTSYSNERKQPLTPSRSVAGTPRNASLNDHLNAEFIDVGTNENAVWAHLVTKIAGFVAKVMSPRMLLIVLRILKAVTICFLILMVIANLMYIFFLEILAGKEVRNLAGGGRDLIIRIYGLFLSFMAVLIEADVAPATKQFYGFKGFIPRGLLLFFVSVITAAHPLHGAQDENWDDDAYYDNDDIYQIPNTPVVFQMVTSFVVGVCGMVYLIFGLLCLDRFTSQAFLSTEDPLVSTAIPAPSGVQPMDVENTGYRTP